MIVIETARTGHPLVLSDVEEAVLRYALNRLNPRPLSDEEQEALASLIKLTGGRPAGM